MTTFKITVTYAAGTEQEHPGLTEQQVSLGTGAFLGDLIDLGGRGIRKLVVEVEHTHTYSDEWGGGDTGMGQVKECTSCGHRIYDLRR